MQSEIFLVWIFDKCYTWVSPPQKKSIMLLNLCSRPGVRAFTVIRKRRPKYANAHSRTLPALGDASPKYPNAKMPTHIGDKKETKYKNRVLHPCHLILQPSRLFRKASTRSWIQPDVQCSSLLASSLLPNLMSFPKWHRPGENIHCTQSSF